MIYNEMLRRNARAQLGGNIFHSKWLTVLLVCGVSAAAGLLASAIPVAGAIALFVVTGAITYGTVRVLVKNAKGQKWQIEEVFCGFKEGFVKTLLLHLLHTVLLFLWSLLFVIPGIVKGYSYAMAYYLQQEPGGLRAEPSDLITQSRRMMDGYKWQLFCLDFSFFGWYLLGALCFGIGIFFVTPYHQQARANFYLALRAERGWDAPVSFEQEFEPTEDFTQEDEEEVW